MTYFINGRKAICQKQLLKRGWSKGLIEKFFPTPSLKRKNPKNPRFSKMKLYFLYLVIQTEELPGFRTELLRVLKRSAAAKKGGKR